MPQALARPERTQPASSAPAPAVQPHPETAALYRAHFQVVWHSLRRLGVRESALDDAVHDTFLVAHRKLAEFEGSSGHRAWLFAIALRVSREYRRRDGRLWLDDPADSAAADAFPDDAAELRRRAQLLDALLDTLSAEQREVFVMAEVEGFSAPEIADALCVKLNTVYSRLRLARNNFKRALARHSDRRAPRRWKGAAPMTSLDVESGCILVQRSQADVPPALAEARIWQRVSQDLDAPLPPAAAAAAAAASRALDTSGSGAVFSGVLVKFGLGAVLIGSLGTGINWYSAPRAPGRATARQTELSKLRATAEPLTPPSSEAAVSVPSAPPVLPPSATATRPKLAGSALEAEAALIADAQRALNAAEPMRALTLLARHRAQFPRGELAPEREAARVFALCAVGQRAEALATREHFLRAFPHSPLAARVHIGCEH